MVFSGVGKSAPELAAALHAGIAQINVESAEELATLSALAAARGVTARIALRVNPDVDAATHTKIATGRAGDKFGIAYADAAGLYAHAAGLPGVAAVGLAVHIGSQIFTMAPYAAAYARMAALTRDIRAAGHPVHTMDCGGGLAIPYAAEPAPLPEAWAATIARAFAGLDLDLAVEPGRWIAAPAGVLLTRVIRVRRQGVTRPIVIVDAAMNDPGAAGHVRSLAWHCPGLRGHPRRAGRDRRCRRDLYVKAAIFWARGRLLPALAEGDLLAVLDAGAYGAVMSSTYNARPLAAQCMGDGGRSALIRARGEVEAPWQDEITPVFAP